MFLKNGFKWLMAGLAAACVCGQVQARDTAPSHEQADASADAQAVGPAAEQAIVTARETLARSSDPSLRVRELKVLSVKAHTWNNSGLGCSPPRAMTSPVITEGFIVVFALPDGGRRQVNVSGSNAIVCDPTEIRRARGIALPAANVGVLAQKARADLAERLGVPVDEIVVVKFTPVRWKNTALECPLPNEAPKASLVRGYRLQLRHKDQTFTYHTDYENVRPCPPISSK
jgi:hypothetical protein